MKASTRARIELGNPSLSPIRIMDGSPLAGLSVHSLFMVDPPMAIPIAEGEVSILKHMIDPRYAFS